MMVATPRACTTRRPRRPRDPRRHRRPVVRQRRPWPREDRRGDPEAGRHAGLRADLPDGPPARRSSWRPLARITPARPRPRVLHQLRLGAVDTALKIALAYHRARARAAHAPHRPRARLSRRRLRRHLGRRHRRQPQDVRRAAAGVDHLPHTHDLASNAFSRGQPAWGAHLADELERSSRCTTPRPSPPSSSSRWRAPPACSCRRRAISEAARDLRQARHPADLRRGHHRLRPPRRAFAPTLRRAPDMITFAKAVTNATVPMGGVIVARRDLRRLHDRGRSAIEFFHGYTYSGHPLACAAGLATLGKRSSGPRRSCRVCRPCGRA
jgi:beta-alanine--pyruvate transaminase